MSMLEINQTSVDRYGHNVLFIGTVACTWLADYILETKGIDVLPQIQEFRAQHGKPIPSRNA
jgi:hypothetical protein